MKARRARIGDVAAISTCIEAAYAAYRQAGIALPPVADGIAEDIRDNQVWVAEAEAEVAGVLIAVVGNAAWHLANIAVDPQYSGRGVGRQLLDVLERAAWAAGAQRLNLTTHVEMPQNIALYQHLGWSETGREESKVFMQKGLKGPLGNEKESKAMTMQVYLSGEIHTDWREQIIAGAAGLDVAFSAPVTDHGASDDCGVSILGSEPNKFWHDHKGAKMNAIRTRRLIEQADVVVVRFGEKYKQWNAAFDAGYASALGKSLIVLHGPDHQHALKEVDAAALAVTEEPRQVVEILRYVLTGALPR